MERELLNIVRGSASCLPVLRFIFHPQFTRLKADNMIIKSKNSFYLLLGVLFLFSLKGYSQPKYEKELRISALAVPLSAKSFVDSFSFDKKIKWYKEIGIDQVSYEAKTRYKGENYSIEFSEDGSFKDVEIKISANKIPADVFSGIHAFLTQKHKNFKLERIQIQYEGDRNAVLAYLQKKTGKEKVAIGFEIVLSTKTGGEFQTLEYFFSETGEFIRMYHIILSKTDHIEY